MMSLPAFVFIVLANPSITDAGTYRFLADGRQIAELEVRSKGAEPPKVEISVPAGSKQLTVERHPSLPETGADAGRRSKTFDLISVASITKPLREERPAVSLAGLPAAADALLRAVGSEYSARDLGLGFGTMQKPEDIAEAEARLGYRLDPELTAVLTTLGPVKFGDHGMVKPADFVTTERQFMRLWGAEEKVAGEERALYRASTMIWVEAGDGYGAVIYGPKGPKFCGGAPAYWKIHQDTIDNPRPVGGSAGGCGKLADVLMRVIGEELLVEIEDDGAGSQLLVDPTMPEPFTVWLETEGNGTPKLRADWTKLY
jgi:hypothetical protein